MREILAAKPRGALFAPGSAGYAVAVEVAEHQGGDDERAFVAGVGLASFETFKSFAALFVG